MFNFLVFKNREIVIPIVSPTLDEALRWVETTLLREGTVVASVLLEEKEMIHELYRKSVRDLKLPGGSRLQIEIDAPDSLLVQSLAVACDLAKGILRRVKELGLESWSVRRTWPRTELEEIFEETKLLLDLVKHMNFLNDGDVPLKALNDLASLISHANADFGGALIREDRPSLANLLESHLFLYMKDLLREGESLQINALTYHQAMAFPLVSLSPRALNIK